MKIAVLTNGDIYNRKGFFNAVFERTKHLIDNSSHDIDVYLFAEYDSFWVRKLRGSNKVARPKRIIINGVRVNILWHPFSIIDHILKYKFHLRPIFESFYYKQYAKLFKEYDCLISHSMYCANIADRAKRMFNIPYTVTWHGSDIHTAPFTSDYLFKQTAQIIQNADTNIFVSKALCETSKLISTSGIKEVIYNGCSDKFYKYSINDRRRFRTLYGLSNERVIVFLGGLVDIKNVKSLPEIFKCILKNTPNVFFWIIGDGKLRVHLEDRLQGFPVKFWGDRDAEVIPQMLNCSDVLVLPSKNEGLPLVILEALKCGCKVVGSNVGGIPEVIGEDHCVDINASDFAARFAEKVIDALASDNDECRVPEMFDWTYSAKIECEVIDKILGV